MFPEIDYTRVDKIKGMNITLTTTAKNDEEGRELLKVLGVSAAQNKGGSTINGANRKIRQDAKKPKFKVRVRNRCRLLRPRRAATCASFRCAASVSAAWRSRAKFPAW